MPVRHLELPALVLDLVEQPDVLDRDRGLVGERLHDVHLAVREAANGAARDQDHADRLALHEQRHSQHGS